MEKNPDLILNLSASPFNYDQARTRKNIVRANVDRYRIPMFYVNHCGAQTELIFDGGSLVVNQRGIIVDEMPYFEECIRHYDLDNVQTTTKDSDYSKPKTELIHDALISGLRDYFQKLGFTKAVLGLSGGIDSAVTAVLAAKALGSANVRCLLMPSQFSSSHSVDDARQLAENTGMVYDVIPIEDMYNSFMDKLQPVFGQLPFNVTEENIQARIRGILNMAISNKYGHILLNTSNKSEMAVGYGTLYGDLCGGLSVLGDVYKTEVYELAGWINQNEEIIPQNTIVKPPSAELRPNQKDSDSLPDYDILDAILYLYIEQRKGPQEIVDMGYDAPLVQRILRLVNINEFKRYQTAPVLRVSPKAFGMGRRMPIVGKYLN
jgi:NAD+ synthase (glutamine-hydrolysing)